MFLQDALVYLVSETVSDYPYPFLTEKTFKGFMTKRPMIITGARHSLQMLRNLGFKTWGDWWDESYDSMEHFYQRVAHITNIIKEISLLSVTDQRRICLEMQEVLEYNFQHYVARFCKTDYEYFLKKIRDL